MTVPVTGPPYWLATVAVYVTDAVITAGFCDDASELVVVAGFTTCWNKADEWELNFNEP
jgi:hypothetical protein